MNTKDLLKQETYKTLATIELLNIISLIRYEQELRNQHFFNVQTSIHVLLEHGTTEDEIRTEINRFFTGL